MRVAPLGLMHYPYGSWKELDREGAEIAAITHGHSLGYMPAAVLVHIIRELVYPKEPRTLKEIVTEAREDTADVTTQMTSLQQIPDLSGICDDIFGDG